MRFLLILLLATPVAAQPSSEPVAHPDREAAFTGLAFAAAVGGTVLTAYLSHKVESPVPVLTLPLLVGGATCGSGRLTGMPGSCGRALRWALLGAAPGYTAVLAGYVLSGGDLLAHGSALWLMSAGVFSLVLIPPFAAVEGYRRGVRSSVAPALLGAPGGGGLAPGVQLRLGL